MQSSNRLLIAAAYAAMCLIWGSTWMVIKIGLNEVPPITGVSLRFLVAGVVILAVVGVRKLDLPRDRRFLWLGLFLGVFQQAIPHVLVYWSELHISSGLTAVLFSTMPFMVALIARFTLGDAMTLAKIVGIVMGILGVWTIFSRNLEVGNSSAVLGMILVLFSVFSASMSAVVFKKFGEKYDPAASLVLPFFICWAFTAAMAFIIDRSNPLQYTWTTWSTIIYLAVMGSVVAFTLFYWLVKRLDVTVVSYQTFVIPIIAVALGWIFLGESITARIGIGAGLIIAGIAIATLRDRTGYRADKKTPFANQEPGRRMLR